MKIKINDSVETSFKQTNIIRGTPKGILIIDSFNNDFFPLNLIDIDTSIFTLPNLKDQYHQEYKAGTPMTHLFMPWHYTVELAKRTYFATATRPLTYKSLLPGYENHIIICIQGNTYNDMYTHNMYKTIAHTIINPLKFIPSWKLKGKENITYHNIGPNFKINQLEKELR
jgi:hypothetical protein